MKIKIDRERLELGMYVSELDRPWIESPFLFQGFPLKSSEEIEQIRAICRYVYVDTERTPADIRERLLLNDRSQSISTSEKKRQPNRSGFTDTISFKSAELEKSEYQEALIKAHSIRNDTRGYIDKMLGDARLGRSVDTQQAKTLVATLTATIVKNPDASMWLTSLKKRDEYTAIHSLNVCVLSITFGRALGLTLEQLNELGLGALLHDVGKMRVPLEVLNKPGKLTDEEFIVMKGHPVTGHELLHKDSSLSAAVLDIVLSHHERTNGKGYPKGATADEINYFTKIVSITDVYDAITSDRVYHDGMTPHEALKNMYNWMPGNYDEELLQAFIRTIGIYPVGSVVEFDSGHVGIIVKINEMNKLKPVVLLVMNRNKEYYPVCRLINLSNPLWADSESESTIKRIVDAKEYNLDVKQIIDQESSLK